MVKEPPIGWTEALGPHASNPPEPRTVGYQVVSLDHTWTTASCEHGLKAQFEMYVRSGAAEAIRDMMRIDPDEAERMRSTYLADFSAKKYKWGGKAVEEVRRSPRGMEYYFFLMVRRCHPEVTEQQATKIMEGNIQGCLEAMIWSYSGNPPPPPRTEANGATLDATLDGSNGNGTQPSLRQPAHSA